MRALLDRSEVWIKIPEKIEVIKETGVEKCVEKC